MEPKSNGENHYCSGDKQKGHSAYLTPHAPSLALTEEGAPLRPHNFRICFEVFYPPDSPAAFSESMRAPRKDGLHVGQEEPDGDKHNRADDDQPADSPPHVTSLTQSRQQSRCAIHWRLND
jgi:hypothetical protein